MAAKSAHKRITNPNPRAKVRLDTVRISFTAERAESDAFEEQAFAEQRTLSNWCRYHLVDYLKKRCGWRANMPPQINTVNGKPAAAEDRIAQKARA